ncbi:cytochrome c peroxidase [Chitinophaga dinghuensis]|uniref:Cytochrome c peroxidase n=1 Tax=Chitinophaga dinghuensis TaxID=1539050 RepID=A0A327VY18_9BACT|nr:cytochrome c peroxidase [Chitinophaga dinghuensis]RAJ80243.1 cytochrome c peroxidase [Chitinophaga dinghuensis]
MNHKTRMLLGTLMAPTIFTLFSCSKKDTPALPKEQPGTSPGGNGTGSPVLPPQLFDYVNAINSMPSYIRDYVNSVPSVDNTPKDNPITNAGATLGRVLFYDKQLSVNNTIACASCHLQKNAFSDPAALSKGFDGKTTRRNSMALVNVRFFADKAMFWDMRAGSLEAQTLMPIQDHIEMGMPSLAALEAKLKQVDYYAPLFKAAFGNEEINSDRISRALSQFVRSIVSFNSRYDQGLKNNFANFTPQEKSGLSLFQHKFCAECHNDLQHSGFNQFPTMLIVENSGRNTGFGSNNGLEENYTDKGIGEITGLPQDQGTFKIPTLKNIALTAPYMHDGRFATLEDVLNHYSHGIKPGPNTGTQIKNGPINLTDQEQKDIIAFLHTLTDQSLVTDPKYADPFGK